MSRKKHAPVRRPTATWKPPRNRRRLLEAVGAGVGVVAVTALAIFLMKPDDPTPAFVDTGVTSPAPGATTGDTTATTPTTPTTAATGDTTATTVTSAPPVSQP